MGQAMELLEPVDKPKTHLFFTNYTKLEFEAVKIFIKTADNVNIINIAIKRSSLPRGLRHISMWDARLPHGHHGHHGHPAIPQATTAVCNVCHRVNLLENTKL